MARELVLDVVARKNSRDLSTLADEFDKAAKKTDDFGNKLNKTTSFSKFLDEELANTKAKVKELGQEFERTGNKDVFAKLRGAQGNVKALEKIKTDLTKALDDGVKDAVPEVEQAGRDIFQTLTDEFDKAAKKTDDFGNKLNKTTSFSKFLDEELANTKAKVKELGQEFERTGNKDVFAKLRGAQGNVSSLEKIKKDLTKALDDGANDAIPNMEQAGKIGGEAFAQQFSAEMQGFESNPISGPAIGIAVAISIAAAAPLIGAALDAALLLGLGGGVLALGIVGQISNPIVHGAFADMANDLTTEFRDATSSFAEPLVGAAHLFGDAFQHDIMPHLKTDFATLSKEVEPLAAGLAGMVSAMMPGFDKAIGAAGPLLHELALDMPTLGASISSFFDSLSGGQQGAIEGLRTLLRFSEGFIETTGKMLEHLSFGYQNFAIRADGAAQTFDRITTGAAIAVPVLSPVANAMHNVRDAWDEVVNGPPLQLSRSLDTTAQDAQRAADNMKELSKEISQTQLTSDSLAGSMTDKLLGSLLSTAHATLGFEESLTRATDSIKQNGRTLDIHTAAGQANAEAVLGMVDANKQMFDQNIANGMSMQDATQKWDDNTQRIYAWGTSVGINKQKLDGLIGTMKNVPDTVNMRMVFDGLQDSIDRLDTLLRKLNGLPYSKEVHVKYFESVEQSVVGAAGLIGGAIGRASGGRIPGYAPGGVIRVGENGPEYLGLGQGTGPMYVTPNSAINGAANGRGDDVIGTLRVVHESPTGDVMRVELVKLGRQRGYTSVDQLLPVSTAR